MKSRPNRLTLVVVLSLVLVCAAGLCAVDSAQAQPEGVSYTFTPTYNLVRWNDEVDLEDTELYGGRLGISFGRMVSLQGFYLMRDDVKTQPLTQLAFPEAGLDAQAGHLELRRRRYLEPRRRPRRALSSRWGRNPLLQPRSGRRDSPDQYEGGRRDAPRLPPLPGGGLRRGLGVSHRPLPTRGAAGDRELPGRSRRGSHPPQSLHGCRAHLLSGWIPRVAPERDGSRAARSVPARALRPLHPLRALRRSPRLPRGPRARQPIPDRAAHRLRLRAVLRSARLLLAGRERRLRQDRAHPELGRRGPLQPQFRAGARCRIS